MNRETVLQQIGIFWDALLNGDEEEQRISFYLYFAYVALQEKWFNIKKEKFYSTPKEEEFDEIDYFLSNIAEL